MSASWPRLARSCSCSSKPLALPSSVTAGGVKAKTLASLIEARAFWTRAATASARSRASVRSSHGLKRTQATAAFWPREPKLKPAMERTDSIDSFSSVSRWVEMRASTCLDCSMVLPGGRMACTYISPWSSCGRKPVGRRLKSPASAATSTSVADEAAHPPLQQEPDHPLVLAGPALVGPVEPAEEALLGQPVPLLDRLEDGGAERRRQAQGDQHREDHRRDDGDGELPVDDAHRPAEEGHGDEDRRQHQRDADQGAGDLPHRLARRRPGRQPLLGS